MRVSIGERDLRGADEKLPSRLVGIVRCGGGKKVARSPAKVYQTPETPRNLW
ncbi:MAG TPA: hypothetical protein VIL97_07665 [Thermoanaerobaculia bacterium]